jgi:geranylgeranyl transferase type-2 subunit beta
MTYLERLAVVLTSGLALVPEDARARHRDYLSRIQQDDGGWAGREGPSDLYYTGFALRSLGILDALTPEITRRAGEYLHSCRQQRTSVVDFFSFLYSAALLQVSGGPDLFAEVTTGWEDRIARELNGFRTSDGGYAKTPGASSGSTYHTFLVALCHEMIDRPLQATERLVGFLHSRQREDGGFVEIGPMKRSGTNPTAAAVATLRMLHHPIEAYVVEFLTSMAGPDGGLRANGRIPASDLLSTFTGLWTLHELGTGDRLARAALKRFASGLAQPDGGFRAGLWDSHVDVEYTFYGLGTLALLSGFA